MWSGPRNISTAMMRAWENRSDTRVLDEPFYAFYLLATGRAHPGADEIITGGETDWRKVVGCLTSSSAGEKPIVYQKQMTHHLLPQIECGWLREVTNCFLIRDPRAVIASYSKKNELAAVEDLGFVQQAEIFDFVVREIDATPPVIDADDVLRNPRKTLVRLCEALGVEFSDTMLRWPAGRRATDGIWAKHWYSEVEKSTTFAPHREMKIEIPPRFREIEDRCRQIYERLHAVRLR